MTSKNIIASIPVSNDNPFHTDSVPWWVYHIAQSLVKFQAENPTSRKYFLSTAFQPLPFSRIIQEGITEAFRAAGFLVTWENGYTDPSKISHMIIIW